MVSRKYTSLPFKEYTVAEEHFDTSRVYPINKIILHSSASTRQGLINTFGGGTRMVSAHYGIDNDGSILAFLEEYNTAYHSGNYTVNQDSIGIEHIDDGATVRKHTNEQYDTSIKLVADICKFYSIPCDLEHIKPHSAIVSTACPNGLNVSRIIDGARILLQTSTTPTPPTSSVPDATSELTRCSTELESVKKDLANQLGKLAQIKSIIYGKSFWWVRWNQIKSLLL